MINDVFFLYLTNDKYEFLWNDFFILLLKYWKDFPYEVLINTESIKYENANLRLKHTTLFNKESSWSDRLIHYLNSTNEEYVILWMDDHFIYDYVDSEKISFAVNLLKDNKKIGHISFENQPGSKASKEFEFLSKRKLFSQYRISLQPGIWNKKYLLKILKKNESPWQLEISGSFRSIFLPSRIYCFNRKVIFTHGGALIMRGKLNYDIANFFIENENIDMNYPLNRYIKETRKNGVILKSLRLLKYILDAVKSIFSR